MERHQVTSASLGDSLGPCRKQHRNAGCPPTRPSAQLSPLRVNRRRRYHEDGRRQWPARFSACSHERQSAICSSLPYTDRQSSQRRTKESAKVLYFETSSASHATCISGGSHASTPSKFRARANFETASLLSHAGAEALRKRVKGCQPSTSPPGQQRRLLRQTEPRSCWQRVLPTQQHDMLLASAGGCCFQYPADGAINTL